MVDPSYIGSVDLLVVGAENAKSGRRRSKEWCGWLYMLGFYV